jgi:hypothetical protein
MPELRRYAVQDAEHLTEGISELFDHLHVLQKQGLEIDEETRQRMIGKAVEQLAGGGSFGSHFLEWILAETGLERRKQIRPSRED